MRIVIFGTWPAMLCKFHGALIDALVARGHEVHLAATGLVGAGDYATVLAQKGAHLHDLPVNRTGLNPATDVLTFLRAVGLFRKIRPDLVLAYTVKPVIYGMLAAAVCGVRRRYALIVGLGYGFTVSGDNGLKRKIIRRAVTDLYRLSLGRSTCAIFQNRDDEAEFRRRAILPQQVPSQVVDGCGVDLDEFPQTPLPADPVFLFVGRLLVDKGVREYAAAARMVRQSHPGLRFLLLGGLDENPTGITYAEVERWTADGHVEWLGYREDIRDIMNRASVFVLPSYREGLPQSGIEALASGRPIVTTDVPGCREIVMEGVNGLLVPPRSAGSLAEAMGFLALDGDLRSRMGQASRTLAETRFSSERISSIMIDLFERSDAP